jgi:NAD-dependent SIR2 family protein deacetylase
MVALQSNLPYFSQRLGCTEESLHHYVGHTSSVNLDFLALVLSKAPSAEWLLTGTGSSRPRDSSSAILTKNHGNTVANNHGVVFNVTCSECKQQLRLATMLIEQQQKRLDDKDHIIRLLESQLQAR